LLLLLLLLLTEDLLGRNMYLTATIVYNRLREHGHWVRQHSRSDKRVEHPLIDLLAWETNAERVVHFSRKRKKSPRDGLLSMCNVDSYEHLTAIAKDKYKWRRLVEEETLREQLQIASAVSMRRSREPRRWLPSDHAKLMRWARESAHSVFDRSDK